MRPKAKPGKEKKQARNHPTNQLPNIPFETFNTHNSKYHRLFTSKKLSIFNTVAIEQNKDFFLQHLSQNTARRILRNDPVTIPWLPTLLTPIGPAVSSGRSYYQTAFDETGNVKYNQVLLRKPLKKEFLESLLCKAKKHPRISEMLPEIRCIYHN